jgi:HrpA-like RNA helicase
VETGRRHPVTTRYLTTPTSNYVDAAVTCVKYIHECIGLKDEEALLENNIGRILVFATGQEDI